MILYTFHSSLGSRCIESRFFLPSSDISHEYQQINIFLPSSVLDMSHEICHQG
jgi:hypothetical protein